MNGYFKYIIFYSGLCANAFSLPSGFVYLHDIDPTIQQEMRYAGNHNFIGRPINGYAKNVCIVSNEAGRALAKVQQQLRNKSYSLKVYDCYRPTRAVADFSAWSKDLKHDEMKSEFYPNTSKSELFTQGYIAAYSGHSRGSTIDLTIVSLKNKNHSINMGTSFDYMDVKSAANYPLNDVEAARNRHFLQKIMNENGFEPYLKEWWHFTLAHEPFPNSYFNFLVE